MDHAQLVHKMWTDIVLSQMHVFVKRVASSQNIADLPSRPAVENLRFMEVIGARERQPVLPADYCRAETWEVLHERLCALAS